MTDTPAVPKDGEYGELTFRPLVGKASTNEYGNVDIVGTGRHWSFDPDEFTSERDWVWTPKAKPLPTKIGSVIRHRGGRDYYRLLRGDGRWWGAVTSQDPRQLRAEDYEVIFDAGAGE
jgi:hypothetical protein